MSQQIKAGKGQVFTHPLLELLHRSSPLSTAITYGTVIAIGFLLNAKFGAVHSFGLGLAIFLAGLFIWTLCEYLMHRFVFHFIHEHPAAQEFHRIVHGYHHEYPRDDDHLFMPPLPGIMLATIFQFFFLLIMQRYSFVFLSGFVTGYTFYSVIHYSIHKYKPPKRLKWLWQHHALHHYKFPNNSFGVSTVFWDKVFGTMPERKTRNTEPVDVSRVNEGHSLMNSH